MYTPYIGLYIVVHRYIMYYNVIYHANRCLEADQFLKGFYGRLHCNLGCTIYVDVDVIGCYHMLSNIPVALHVLLSVC